MTGLQTTAPPLLRAAQWAIHQRVTGLDAETAHDLTRATVDWFAATVAGHDAEPVRILRTALSEDWSAGRSALVPSGERVPVRTAALLNASAAHAAELDDIYREGLFHPGASTVAAALAVGQARARSGTDMLTAIGTGIEIATRVAAALQPAHYRHWHTTGTVGPIGAAAAAALLSGGDADALAHAMATATTLGSGLQRAMHQGSMNKPLHAGHAAEAGVLAGQAAVRGLRGALDVLDGLGAATADGPDWSGTFDDLDTVRNAAALSVKAHACCGHIFAPIDAAVALRDEHGIDPASVEHVEVATYGAALRVAGNPRPRTRHEAQFSIAFCVATALTYGEVPLAAFTPQRLGSVPLRDLAARVELAVDPGSEADFPGRRGARVRVRLRDGRVVEHRAPTRRGDPDAPLSDDDLREKFDTYVEPVLGAARASELARRLWSLAETDDVTGLVDLREVRS
ncbi:MmgE/PrpD family protein [Jiangella asiatica]|uniref:MmgE/PrpD family protein n=1 Tax=Jiangella asiatica TaxID=2530372 RepID=A0A4R5D6Y3_9ACTN|nr:MmgE/PrpD family protein [Jiangella asiatica]TDE07441.1 MmgE/PrpD family protein [Jiangella asiatica]